MPWAKLDDGFHEHPKIASMSDKAFRLYVYSITYSRRHKLKGILSDGHRLVLFRLTGACQDQDDELVLLRGWDIREDGTRQIHDIEAWNPEYAEELLQKRSEAGRAGGIQSGITRSKRSKDEASCFNNRSKREANVKLRESDSDTDSDAYKKDSPPVLRTDPPRGDGEKREPVKRFVPPTAAEAEAYFTELGHGARNLGAKFTDHYGAAGWKLKGGNPMKDWRCAIREWCAREKERGNGTGQVSGAGPTSYTDQINQRAIARVKARLERDG